MTTDSYKAIDAVVNIWTEEALRHRPGWGDDFFTGKMNAADNLMAPMSLEKLIETLDEAGIDKGLPDCRTQRTSRACPVVITCPTKSSHAHANNTRIASMAWPASIHLTA